MTFIYIVICFGCIWFGYQVGKRVWKNYVPDTDNKLPADVMDYISKSSAWFSEMIAPNKADLKIKKLGEKLLEKYD